MSARGLAAMGRGVARIVALFIVLGFFLSPVDVSVAQESSPAATPGAGPGLQGAVDWMTPQQGEDGGFPGFSGTSDPTATANYVIALGAAANAGIDVADPLERAWSYLSDNAISFAQSGAAQAALLSLAAAAAGEDPVDIGGVLPLTLATSATSPENGLYGFGVYDHAIVVMALAVAGQEIPAGAIAALADVQLADGSWAFDATTTDGAGDTNTTAMVIQALVAAGEAESDLIPAAVAFLGTTRTEDGGYGYSAGAPLLADANSTALVVQALIATGVDVAASEDLAGLEAFQNPSGAFRYQDADPADNGFATVQAIPALAGFALPVVAGSAAGGTPVAMVGLAA